MSLLVIATILLCGLLCGPAHADLAAAERAYGEGRWQAAAEAAQGEGDADGYAYAARALLAQLMVEPDHPDRAALVERAAGLAERALELDAANVEARIRLATALGYRGRQMSNWRAYFNRLPQRGKDLLDEAVAAEPDNAWARGLLGAWHLEIARRGGTRGLHMFGASIESGIAHYRAAIALDPGNPAPRYFMAIGLAALDDPAFLPLAREQVGIVLALPARDAFDAGIQAEARRFAERLGDPSAAASWASARMAR